MVYEQKVGIEVKVSWILNVVRFVNETIICMPSPSMAYSFTLCLSAWAKVSVILTMKYGKYCCAHSLCVKIYGVVHEKKIMAMTT